LTAAVRHVDVENDNVGAKLAHHGDALVDSACGTEHLEVGLPVDDQPQRRANLLAVVNDDHAQ
jgi:hypothetical protein